MGEDDGYGLCRWSVAVVQSVKSRIQVCNYFLAGSGPESTSWHFGSLLPLSITRTNSLWPHSRSIALLGVGVLLVRGERRGRSQRGEGMSTSEVELSASLLFMGAVSFLCWPSTKVFTGKAVRHNGFFWLFNNQITPPLSTPFLKLTSHSLPCAASSCLDSHA